MGLPESGTLETTGPEYPLCRGDGLSRDPMSSSAGVITKTTPGSTYLTAANRSIKNPGQDFRRRNEKHVLSDIQDMFPPSHSSCGCTYIYEPSLWHRWFQPTSEAGSGCDDCGRRKGRRRWWPRRPRQRWQRPRRLRRRRRELGQEGGSRGLRRCWGRGEPRGSGLDLRSLTIAFAVFGSKYCPKQETKKTYCFILLSLCARIVFCRTTFLSDSPQFPGG